MFGAVFGRWWRVTLLASALGWPLLLVVTAAMSIEPALLGASALAVLNTGAGVLIHRGILHAGRTLWRGARPPASGSAGGGGGCCSRGVVRVCAAAGARAC